MLFDPLLSLVLPQHSFPRKAALISSSIGFVMIALLITLGLSNSRRKHDVTLRAIVDDFVHALIYNSRSA